MDKVLRMPEATVVTSIDEAIDGFLSVEGAAVVSATGEMVAQGDFRSFFVPAVKLAVDAVLSIMRDERVSAQLPAEVHDRGNTMAVIGVSVGESLVESGYLHRFYSAQPELSEAWLPDALFPALADKTYVGSLCGAPFTDVSFVAGGALSLLGRNGVSNKLEAIKRSRGLLAVSGVQKDFQSEVRQELGVPYVRRSNLRVTRSDEGPKAEFRKSALDVMSRYMGDPSEGRGCAAGRVKSYTGATVLGDYWPRFVDLVVSEEGVAKRAKA